MEKLQEELLYNIFSYFDMQSLEPVSHVCSRWHDIITNSNHLNSHFALKHHSDIHFLTHSPRAAMIKTFVINSTSWDLLDLFKRLSKNCQNITKMKITGDFVSRTDVRVLRRSLPNLKTLDLHLKYNKIDPIFTKIATELSFARYEHDHDDDDDDDDDTYYTEKGESTDVYESVCSIDLTQCNNDFEIQYEHVTKLTIKSTKLLDRNFYLLANCKNLEELHLYHCWLMTESALMALSSLKHLRVLKLTGLPNIMSYRILEFLRRLKTDNLKELNLNSSSFTDEHIAILIEKKVPLTKLSLWNTEVTYDGVKRILRSFPKLRFLNTSLCYSDKLWALCKETKIPEIQFLDRLLTHERLGEYSQSIRKESETLDLDEFESLMHE